MEPQGQLGGGERAPSASAGLSRNSGSIRERGARREEDPPIDSPARNWGSSEKFKDSDYEYEARGGYASSRNRMKFAHQVLGPPPTEGSQKNKSWSDRAVSSAKSASWGSGAGLNPSSYSDYTMNVSDRSRRPWNLPKANVTLLACVALGAVVIYANGGVGRSGPTITQRGLNKLDNSALLSDIMDGDQPMANWLRGGDVDEEAMGQDQLQELHKLKRLHQLHQLQLLQQLHQLQQQGPLDWGQVAKMMGVEEVVHQDDSKRQQGEVGGVEGGLPENPLASEEEGAQTGVVQEKEELDAIQKKLEEIMEWVNKDAGPTAEQTLQAGEALAELEQAQIPMPHQAQFEQQAQIEQEQQVQGEQQAPVTQQALMEQQAPVDQLAKKLSEILKGINKDIGPTAEEVRQAGAALADLEQAQKAPVAEQAQVAQQASVDQVQEKKKQIEDILARINKDIGPTAEEARQAGEALAELEQAQNAPVAQQAPTEPQAPVAQQATADQVAEKKNKLFEILDGISKGIGPTAEEVRQAGAALADLEQAQNLVSNEAQGNQPAQMQQQSQLELQAPVVQQAPAVRIMMGRRGGS